MSPQSSGEPVPAGISQRLCRLMAGLDAGVSGAVLCLTWLGFHSWLRGEFWWAKFNVAAAVFFGGSVYSMGLGRATIAGIALMVAIYAALGVAFGLLARTRGFARNLLLGVMVALLWHVSADRFFWRRLDPFALHYFPSLATLPAHLLLAINFSRFAGRFRVLALAFGSPDWSREFIEPPELEPVEVQEAPPLELAAVAPAEPGPQALPDPNGLPPAETAPPAQLAPPTFATLLLLAPASEPADPGAPPESSSPPPPAPVNPADSSSEPAPRPPQTILGDTSAQNDAHP